MVFYYFVISRDLKLSLIYLERIVHHCKPKIPLKRQILQEVKKEKGLINSDLRSCKKSINSKKKSSFYFQKDMTFIYLFL